MTKSAYTLKESENSGELHLFKGKIPADDPGYKCTSNRTSICERMTKEDSVKNKFSCADEDEARRKCAAIGRNVCGTCVSHLYASY